MNITASSVWSKCLKFIKDNIQPQAYKTWFEPIKAIKLADGVLSVEVPSKFFYEWLEEHYVKILKVALQKTLGDNAKLVYVIKMQNTYFYISSLLIGYYYDLASGFRVNISAKRQH